MDPGFTSLGSVVPSCVVLGHRIEIVGEALKKNQCMSEQKRSSPDGLHFAQPRNLHDYKLLQTSPQYDLEFEDKDPQISQGNASDPVGNVT